MTARYSQKDKRWSKQKLGSCKDTIRQSGCKVTSIAMIYSGTIKNPKGKVVIATPAILDWLFTVNKVYVQGCLIADERVANFLGLKFNGRSNTAPSYPTIAETNHFKRYGVPQHFFVHLPNGQIIDPLDSDPKPKANPYHIVSFRLFEKPEAKEKKGYKAKYKKYKRKYQEVKEERDQILEAVEKKFNQIKEILE